MRIPLSALVLGESPRQVPHDIGHLQALAEVAEDLPPIVVHRSTMRVVDGVHRVHACRIRGWSTIEARYLDGDDEDVYLLAVALNVRHGMPLSLSERRAAAERVMAMRPSWSDRSIAKISGLSPKSVGAIRERSTAEIPQLNTRVGDDGRVRPLSTRSGRQKAGRMIAERPAASLREVAAECGISLGTAHDVRRRLEQGLDPVPDGRRDSGQGLRKRGPAAGPGDTAESVRRRLELMSREPGLKYSSDGRRTLLQLRLALIDEGERLQLLEAVPEHWMGTVAQLARFCADQWQSLAEEADRRREHSA
ncbi:ParB N-terminal domain-containing protein [Streptomyces sp. NPDC059534]|uniref:ParB N-terminal domain-containing protein n=1 Tax=Streptomyces sp. NPDC059534 TaxID=3346859 RepID=UPI003673A3FA